MSSTTASPSQTHAVETAALLHDSDLIERYRLGDNGALDTLVRRHQLRVFRLALRMTWQRQSAEDAAQEILVKVVRRLDRFRGECAFGTWLHRIAVNHLISHRRSRAARAATMSVPIDHETITGAPLDVPDPGALPGFSPLIVEEVQTARAGALLHRLNARQRVAYVLGEILGEDSATSAAVIGTTRDNFRQLLKRARNNVRDAVAAASMPAGREVERLRTRLAALERAHAALRPAGHSKTPDRVTQLRLLVIKAGLGHFPAGFHDGEVAAH